MRTLTKREYLEQRADMREEILKSEKGLMFEEMKDERIISITELKEKIRKMRGLK